MGRVDGKSDKADSSIPVAHSPNRTHAAKVDRAHGPISSRGASEDWQHEVEERHSRPSPSQGTAATKAVSHRDVGGLFHCILTTLVLGPGGESVGVRVWSLGSGDDDVPIGCSSFCLHNAKHYLHWQSP